VPIDGPNQSALCNQSAFCILQSAIAALVLLAVASDGYAQPPTFNQNVAPIFYARCVSCHRPGEVAPMSLLTYEEARPWVRAIRTRVAAREMPPWFADPRFGRGFVNDPRLTDAELHTILAWVDGGAPRGSGDPPAPPSFVDGWRTFKGRPPDAIVEMPAPFEIPANGALPIFTLWSPNPFKEDKFIEAVELRPGAVDAVHHSDVTARTLPAGTTLGRGAAWPGGPAVDFVPIYPDGTSYNELTAEQAASRRAALHAEAFRTTDDYRLLFYVPGGGFQQFPPGAVKRISARNALAWGVHYTPTGKPTTDRHRLGLWFAQAPPAHEVITKRIGEAHIIEGKEFVAERADAEFPAIPPNAPDWRITAITPILDDVTVYALWPHMHRRGKDMTFIATYPDGREEILLHVPKYDFQWQLQYQLVEPAHLPAGSTIKAIGHYDNSSGNRNNPRPFAAVSWSEQSWDEMFNGWMELSVDRDVINRGRVYTLATPTHGRVSLGIGAGPPGKVYVRNADGTVLASATIGSAPTFIEPWTFARGQTIQTERIGSDIGNVTVTMFDVPPDVTRAATIGGPAVQVVIEQPGQNGAVTFAGRAGQPIAVHISGNSTGGVAIRITSKDGGTPLASASSAASSFGLPPVTLPATGTYVVVLDPTGPRIGALNVSVAEK
jgi:hypothetical protein